MEKIFVKLLLGYSIAFKALGLEWLTGYARRFAYNVGAIDAYLLARSYVKAVKKKGKV